MPPRHAGLRQLFSKPQSLCVQCRHLHKRAVKPIPSTTPFVPDAQTFLTLIGRGLSQHAAKIPSWEALFSLSSEQLRESGVEPARARRYLLWWRDRFRNGLTGIGGDLKDVTNGVAELRVVQVRSKNSWDQEATLTKDPGVTKVIANTALSAAALSDGAESKEEKPRTSRLAAPQTMDASQIHTISGLKLVQGRFIAGRGVEQVKGHPGVARLRVTDGLWENRRGHKVDGGERRKAEVRSKRRAAEKRNAR